MIPGGIHSCPYAKIIKLEMELRLERALSTQKNEYEAKLDAAKRDNEATIASMRSEFDIKLRATQKEWKVDLSGLKSFVDMVVDHVKAVDAKCIVLLDDYKHVKDAFELRTQSIQFSVIKVLGGIITVGRCSLATYHKLKEELRPHFAKLGSMRVVWQGLVGLKLYRCSYELKKSRLLPFGAEKFAPTTCLVNRHYY